MMQRERVAEDIFVFRSDLYAQVTAGLIVTTDGLVLIDTLLYPEETRQIQRFIQRHYASQPIRYVINTHHHADHTTGTSFFPEAQVVAHRLCRDMLDTRGRVSMEHIRSQSPDMHDVSLVLPNIVFDHILTLRVGNKTLRLEHMPGHSVDSIICLVAEDNVLFAADLVMSLPYFVDGSYNQFLQSLEKLQEREFDCIVQGHGEVILRGEAPVKIADDINYLQKLRVAVDKALMSSSDEKKIKHALSSIKVGACGKSHILLNGLVEQLHYQNVLTLGDERQRILLKMD